MLRRRSRATSLHFFGGAPTKPYAPLDVHRTRCRNLTTQDLYNPRTIPSYTPLQNIAAGAMLDRPVTSELVELALRELPQTRLGLLARNQALHTEVDRSEGEASFRLQLAPALLGFGVVLVTRDAVLVGILIALVALGVFVQGVALAHEGNDHIIRLGDEHAPIAVLRELPDIANELADGVLAWRAANC